MLLNVYRKSCRIGLYRYGREFSEQGNRKNNRAGALRWFNICPQMLFWRKGDPFQGPKLGSCLTLGNELSEETHVLTKQEILLGKDGEQLGKETQENSSVTWLGFMVMALVSRLSLANHSDSESFLVVHAFFSQGGCQREGFWEGVGQVVSPFDLSWILPVGGGLLVPCSFSRTSCHKTTHANGY